MRVVRYSESERTDPESVSGAHELLLATSRISSRILVPTELFKSITQVDSQNTSGVGHVWPSHSPCPIEVLLLSGDSGSELQLNRNGCFEVLYLCSGSAIYHVQDRILRLEEGDLAILGSTLCQRIEWRTSPPGRLVALFFDPDLIRCDGAGDGAEYLIPFLLQDTEFPCVVPAKTDVPNQVLDLILRIRSELPASSSRACLAVRTYLKMLLMLLVNQYSSYTATVEKFQQQRSAIYRLRPLLQCLSENCVTAFQVGDAARMCGMSESHFMSFFQQIMGLSFVKYLNQYRIQRAQALLAKTDRSIADISLDTGYCDQSYFGAVFRRFVGITPAAYRRRYHEGQIIEEQQSNQTRAVTALSSLGSRRPLAEKTAASTCLA